MKNYLKQPLLVFGGIFSIATLVLVGILFYQVKGLTSGDNLGENAINPSLSISEVDSKEYQLSDRATDYQKEIFDLLVGAQQDYQTKGTENSEKLYAELVVKNFIADFYTWSNKTGRNDVGGLQFIAEDLQSTFRKQAIDGFYGNLDFYLNQYDSTSLITVNNVIIEDVNLNDSIEIEVEDEEEEIVTEEVACISVKATWEYEVSSLDEEQLFQHEATFILTESANNLVINAIFME